MAVVWLLRRSGGESYLGRQLFSACDVARNTSGSSHCFIREHINNFHWCMCVCVYKRERERASQAEFIEFMCVCVFIPVCASKRKVSVFPRIFSRAGGVNTVYVCVSSRTHTHALVFMLHMFHSNCHQLPFI